MKWLLIFLLPLTLSAAVKAQSTSSAIEAGRVMGTLDDWRAITFVLVFCIMAQWIFIGTMMVAAARERRATAKAMKDERDAWVLAGATERRETNAAIGANLGKVGDSLDAFTNEVKFMKIVATRIESLGA